MELPRAPMPEKLQRIYGHLGFEARVIYSNFVSSLDGVVTLGSTPSAGSAISGRNPPDRFLLALLRAFADAVLIGAGTLRGTPGHSWSPEHVYPDLAAEFRDLRKMLGRRPQARLIVLTARGDLDLSHPAVVDGATILTTTATALRLRGRLPKTCDVIEVGESGPVDSSRAMAELQSRGYDAILTEGGPHVLGELIDKNLLDEAFLTISPVIAGRAGESRLGMVEGVELLPGRGAWTRLLSARRNGDFLFLRYGVKGD